VFATSIPFHRSQKRHNIKQNDTQYTQYKWHSVQQYSALSVIVLIVVFFIVTLNFVVLGVEALAENALAYLASDEGKKFNYMETWKIV
jgi:hypothetical protein